MLRVFPLALLALWVAFVATPAAFVHAQGRSTTVKARLRGIDHEVTVPAGWTARVTDVGVDLTPPGAAGALLKVAVVATDHAGGSGRDVLGKLVDGEKRRKPHYKETTSPEPIAFAGGSGSIVILAGTGAGGELEGEMLVVAVVGDTVYLMSAEGTLGELNKHVDDLATIIGGVRRADAGGPGGGGGGASGGGGSPGKGGDAPAGELGDLLKGTSGAGNGSGGGGKPGDPAGGKPAVDSGGPYWFADPAFGVKLRPLRFWRWSVTDDEYQLERTNEQPAAVVAVRHVVVKDKKKYLAQAGKRGRARTTRFAGAEALLVETRTGDTIERTYHLVRGDHALELEFRVVARGGDSGVDARVFEVEQAVLFDDAGVGKWSDGTTELTSLLGVKIQTAPEWTLTAVAPGRANFRSDRGVEVEVRVRPWPQTGDPMATAEDAVKAACKTGAYTRADAAVLGASSAARFRCAHKSGSQVVLVAAGQTVASSGGAREKVLVRVTGKNPKKKAVPPDAALAEFGAYVTLPR